MQCEVLAAAMPLCNNVQVPKGHHLFFSINNRMMTSLAQMFKNLRGSKHMRAGTRNTDKSCWANQLPDPCFCCTQVVCQETEAFASACAIARAYPQFNEKSVAGDAGEGKDTTLKSRTVTVEFLLAGSDKGKKLMAGAEEAMAAAADGLWTVAYL